MKIILITGAKSVIGKALALLTAKNKHRLILLVLKESDAKLLTEEIKAETNNPNIEVFASDLSNQDDISLNRSSLNEVCCCGKLFYCTQ